MNSRHSPDHTAHDPLAIARLFGDDLDDAERDEALGWLAECAACQALYADLGDDASAISAMPVPPRPRDFTLTPADAARLRGTRRSLRGLGTWTRPLGTLLSGVGAVALAVLVAGGQFGVGASSQNTTQERGAAAYPAASAAATGAALPIFGTNVTNGTQDGALANASASAAIGQVAATGKLAVVTSGATAGAATPASPPFASGSAGIGTPSVIRPDATGAFIGPAAATARSSVAPEHDAATSRAVAAATGGAGGSKAATNEGAVVPQNGKPGASNGSPVAAASSPDLRLIAGAAASLMLAVGLLLLGAAAVARRRGTNGR